MGHEVTTITPSSRENLEVMLLSQVLVEVCYSSHRPWKVRPPKYLAF